jgi:hypothetical protein
MKNYTTRIGPAGLVVAALVAGQLAAPRSALAFSQSSPITPMGHEWITVASALELLNQPKPTVAQLAKDKGKTLLAVVGDWIKVHLLHWDRMSKAKALQQGPMRKAFLPAYRDKLIVSHTTDVWPRDGIGGYSARYYNVWSAVMGQRWVDLGGFNVVRSGKCWDAITQMGDAQQPDHFLRRRNDIGPKGAIAAVEAARANFKKYFREAVVADPADRETITFRDGGADVKAFTARKAYFLFGRAAHLFQDSFSIEHGQRDPETDYKRVTDIKSYVCTSGSSGHTHDKPLTGKHGDVIWFHDLASMGHDYSDKNVKPYALAAILAMEDLWVAFMYARYGNNGDKAHAADRFADTMLTKWMSYEPAKLGQTDQSTWLKLADQPACDKKVEMPAIATTERAKCLTELAPVTPEHDVHLGIPYNWKWVTGTDAR